MNQGVLRSSTSEARLPGGVAELPRAECPGILQEPLSAIAQPQIEQFELEGTPTEVLFPEAKRRERHRRLVVLAVVVLAVGGTTIGFALSAARRPIPRPTSISVVKAPAALPAGTYVTMKIAGPLAVAPDGRLYVADTTRDQILVRVPDGRFRVVAGNGHVGFSGDGGPALKAELSRVTDMSFAPNGSLYLADGNRVRVIATDGVIRTLAGNGKVGKMVASGTSALAAPIGSVDDLSIALSPTGELYISRFSQVLRLSGRKLFAVRAVVPSDLLEGAFDYNLFGIAVTKNGDVYVSGFNGWSVWKIDPGGIATEIGLPSEARQSGGAPSVLERAPNGAVYAEGGSTLLRVEGSELVPTSGLLQPIRGGSYFWLTNFAFAPNGVVYADEIPGGGGFEHYQQLIAVERGGHTTVLWHEPRR
jgi:hypothetical protein